MLMNKYHAFIWWIPSLDLLLSNLLSRSLWIPHIVESWKCFSTVFKSNACWNWTPWERSLVILILYYQMVDSFPLLFTFKMDFNLLDAKYLLSTSVLGYYVTSLQMVDSALRKFHSIIYALLALIFSYIVFVNQILDWLVASIHLLFQ